MPRGFNKTFPGLGLNVTQAIRYTDPEEMSLTAGDGDIQKPYQPLGEAMVKNNGLGFIGIPIVKADLEALLVEDIVSEAKEMGGDGIIDLCVVKTGETPIYQFHPGAAIFVPLGFISLTEAEAIGTVINR